RVREWAKEREREDEKERKDRNEWCPALVTVAPDHTHKSTHILQTFLPFLTSVLLPLLCLLSVTTNTDKTNRPSCLSFCNPLPPPVHHYYLLQMLHLLEPQSCVL